MDLCGQGGEKQSVAANVNLKKKRAAWVGREFTEMDLEMLPEYLRG